MTPGRPRKSRWHRPAKAGTVPGALNMKETVLQDRVGRYARDKGLLHYHTYRSDRSEAGFPDSVIVGNWVMWRELKSDSDNAKVSAEQKKWIERLEALGQDVDVWWPIDWESGRIQNEINACARRRHATGELIMPDLAKTLFLMADARPAAGILWDAGAKGIDRVTWEGHARALQRSLSHALPTGTAEILAWLEKHNIGSDAAASEIIEALREDIAGLKGEQFLG